MIDSVKIKIENFTGKMDNCEFDYSYRNIFIYQLYNKSRDSSLKLIQNTSKNSLVIINSLRKWYLGETSLLDLNSKTFKKAILKLSKLLGISSVEICNGSVTQCEIGLNVKVRIPCEKIIPKISKYSSLKRYEYDGETVGFLGSNKELKIYHKCLEINANSQKGMSKFKAFARLQEKGNYFLRIEFTLLDKQSFEQHDLDFIRTIGDIATNYSVLYEFWTSQIDKVIMSNIIIYEDNMTPKEFLISNGIDHLGLNEFIKEYYKIKSKSSKTITTKNKATAKSKVTKEVLDIFHKYESREEYNKNKLRTDIAKALIRIKSKDESIELPVLIRNLWGGTNDIQLINTKDIIIEGNSY